MKATEAITSEPALEEHTEVIAGVSVKRECRLTHQENGPDLVIWLPSFVVPVSYQSEMIHDQRRADLGIITKPNQRLINFGKTAELYSTHNQKVQAYGIGIDFAAQYLHDQAVAICPSNWGQQYGEILIENGKLVTVKGDNQLTGNFPTICKGPTSWEVRNVYLDSGATNSGDISDVSAGFSGPLIIKDGKSVNFRDVVHSNRAFSDPRNFVDVSAGSRYLTNRTDHDGKLFWETVVRNILPIDETNTLKLLLGERVALPALSISDGDLADFEKLVAKVPELNNHYRVDKASKEITVSDLPPARIPTVAIGTNIRGELVVVVVDGRQSGISEGVTLFELQTIMQEKGARNAIIGSSGSDAAIGIINDNLDRQITRPSSFGNNFNRVWRPVPNMLLIYENK